ncbi:hypothetical protein HPB48_020912 [Haemaphysalis longicornis]|uniref:Carboxylesterase type B domain-containing protein n=1 Tax=Haemaphysalis longicornis TaxID=44386 RepID=A0A9J6FI62_HAELO|nr:hypothetical protein HPB48_020912 [Haemaphysalis longicornis]
MVVALTGDWFQTGTNSDYDWAELAVLGDLVVVSPNHRHGVAGFLNVPFNDAAKNSAVEDVILALSWIRRNAALFDGDPDNIVALGHGSGAFLLLSVILKGREGSGVVFKRALLQGPPLPSMPLPRNTPDMGVVYVRNISQSLSFRGHKPEEQFSFLKEAEIKDLLRASQELRIPLRFVPSGFENGPKTLERSVTGANLPAGFEVIVGSDLSEGRAFNERFILPFALSRKSADDAVSLFETVCVFVKEAECSFDRRNSAGVDWLKTLPKGEFLEHLALFWTTCSSVAIADAIAGTKARVYHYVSEGSRLLEGYLSPDAIAEFLASG